MKKIISLLLVTSIIILSVPTASAQDHIGIYASGYCLMDSETLEVLSDSSMHTQLPMASTTKIMTVILALERGEREAVVSIPAEAVGVEGSSVYLKAGEKLSLDELLQAVMLESANDAAVAVAISVAGSVEKFAVLMNEKASILGMKDSHFVNPHGLPENEHYSTAYDMALLMSYCMKNPEFAHLTSTEKSEISCDTGKRYLSNHNKLLWLYEYCIGGKTGFTKIAGRCLVSAAERDGVRLVAVTLGAPDDWSDHKKMYDYGFSLYSEKLQCEAGEYSYEIPVVGSETKSVTAKNSGEVSFAVRESDKITTSVEMVHFLYAPFSEGERVGKIVFYRNGVCAGESEIYANGGADYYTPPTLWDRIKAFFD